MKTVSTGNRLFFDYMRLAKEALKNLLLIHPELENLSVRELEVLDELLTDKTLSAIAGDMGLSVSSVHFHCKNIYRKLSVSNRRQLLINYRDLCEGS